MELVKRDQESLFKSFVDASTEFNKKRARLLMQQLEELVKDVLDEEDKELQEALIETMRMPAQKEWTKYIKNMVTESTLKGSIRAGKEIDQLMKKFAAGGQSFAGVLPVQALNYIDTYSPIIAGITDDTTLNSIKSELKESMKRGENLRNTMDHVNGAVNGALSTNRLENIARTESMKFYNAGRVQRYSDPGLDDFVQALQYDAITDARTTDICNELDGKIIDINDRATIAKFTPPNHYMCRATWMPISKYESVKADWPADAEVQEGFRGTPDLYGGQAAALRQIPKTDPTKLSIAKVRKMTDEDWNNVPDETFKNNIRKVEDRERRITLSMTRAEKMFKEKAGFNPGAAPDIPDIRVVHNRFGFSYVIDHKHTVVPIPDDDEFAKAVSILFREGIDKGEVDISSLKFSKYASRDFSKIQDAEIKVNSLLKNGKPLPEFDFSVLDGQDVDPAAIFGKMKLVQTNKPAVAKSVVTQRTKEIKVARQEAEEWIANNFDDADFTPQFRKRFLQIDYGSSRSNAGRDSINMAGGLKIESRVLVHEYMHTMTFNNSQMEDAAQDFFRKRTKGLKVGKINMHGEVGIKDGFYNPYVGRVYEFDKNDPKGYEVMSMGAEAMFADPAMFLSQDPEHFWFIYAMMNGLY